MRRVPTLGFKSFCSILDLVKGRSKLQEAWTEVNMKVENADGKGKWAVGGLPFFCKCRT